MLGMIQTGASQEKSQQSGASAFAAGSPAKFPKKSLGKPLGAAAEEFWLLKTNPNLVAFCASVRPSLSLMHPVGVADGVGVGAQKTKKIAWKRWKR